VKGNGNVDRNVEQQCGESLNTLWRQAGDEACIAAEMYLPNFQDRCCGIANGSFSSYVRFGSHGGINACVVHLTGVHLTGYHRRTSHRGVCRRHASLIGVSPLQTCSSYRRASLTVMLDYIRRNSLSNLPTPSHPGQALLPRQS
jgi:hypothetical protein